MLATVSYMRRVVDGVRMRELREAAELTFKQLEELTGVSASTLWRIEVGKTEPRTQHLAAVASVLGVRPDDLLVKEGEAAVDMPTRPTRPTREPIALRGGNRYPVEVRKMPRIPLLGIVPAAVERYALQGGTIPVPGEALEGVRNPGAVRIVGDELQALRLYDGELAIVDLEAEWRDNEIFLVEVEGQVTFQRVRVDGERLRWEPRDGTGWVEHYTKNVRCLGLLCWVLPPLRKPS